MSHAPTLMTARRPSGSTRGRLSVSPPPVMWASACTHPCLEQRPHRLEVAAVDLQQLLRHRAAEALHLVADAELRVSKKTLRASE